MPPQRYPLRWAWPLRYVYKRQEQAQGYFAGGDPWTFPELYDTMERQDVEAFLAQWVKPEQTSLVVIRPQEERS